MTAIPWYFSPRKWHGCYKSGNNTSCKQILAKFESVCSSESSQCRRYKTEKAAWSRLETAVSKLHVRKHAEESIAFYGSELAVFSLSLEKHKKVVQGKTGWQLFWKYLLHNTDLENIKIDKSWLKEESILSIDRFFLLEEIGILNLVGGVGISLVSKCTNHGHCTEIVKHIKTQCPDIIMNTLFPRRYRSSRLQLVATAVDFFFDTATTSKKFKESIKACLAQSPVTVLDPDEITAKIIKTFESDGPGTKPVTISEKLGEGAYGAVYSGSFEGKSVAVKFNMLQTRDPKEYQFKSLNRDIEGMMLGKSHTNKNIQKWLPKLLGTIKYDQDLNILPFNAIRNDKTLVMPGIIMDLVNEIQADEMKESQMFCKYIQSLKAVLDLYIAGLVHEDLHNGNAALIKGSSIKIKLGQAFIECEQMILVDTGSLNTVTGTLGPMVTLGISRRDRSHDPNKYFCNYLGFFHAQFFGNSAFSFKTKEMKEMIDAMLDEILQFCISHAGYPCTLDRGRYDIFNEALFKDYSDAIARNSGRKRSTQTVQFILPGEEEARNSQIKLFVTFSVILVVVSLTVFIAWVFVKKHRNNMT
jgi:hypothetical protein